MRAILIVALTAFSLEAYSAAGYGDAAGPRTGAVLILQVDTAAPGDVQALVAGGFDIAGVSRGIATIYATPAERDRLLEMGYTVRQTGVSPEPEKVLGIYHTYATLTAELQQFADAHPDICRLQSTGQSAHGRTIWALVITDHPDVEEAEPEVRFAGSIHGNEPPGMELCLYFIDLLLNQYGADTRITNLINSTEIWVLPLLNPDGLESNSRYNADGYDLNRSFPKYPEDFTRTISTSPLNTTGRQPEVAAIMAWSAERATTLAVNFHAGSLVVNYPYDDDGTSSKIEAPTPDDALFRAISLGYSQHNAPMYASSEFEDGITNGAAWYVIEGSLQDWTYRYLGGNEVTIELSNIYKPSQAMLQTLWNDNRESMLSFMETAHWGVAGVVLDEMTGDPVYAEITVGANSHPVYTDPDVGDYHRMLLPGTYTLTINAPGYFVRSFENIVVQAGQTTMLDVMLGRDSDFDGINDTAEGDGDADSDGIPNYLDTDSDGNGILDRNEGAVDLDNDTLANFLDLDNDGDGCNDSLEIFAGSDMNDAASVPASPLPAAGYGAVAVCLAAMLAAARRRR